MDINVEQSLKDEKSIFNYYKNLIMLRKEYPSLVYGRFVQADNNHENVFAYTREYEGEKLLVILNFTDKSVEFSLDNEYLQGNHQLLICNYDRAEQKAEQLQQTMLLQPYEACVYK